VKRIEYSWHIALPFLLAAAAGALDAVLPRIADYHPSTQSGILMVTLAGVLGDWLRAQIARSKQDIASEPQEIHGEVLSLAPAVPAQTDAVALVVDTVLHDWVARMAINNTVQNAPNMTLNTEAPQPAPEPPPAPIPDDRPAVRKGPRALK
jgi:hypothetical protein